MTSDPYTPDEIELIGCYAGAMEEQAGENYDQAKADAERGIAKIRADVLREAKADLDERALRISDAEHRFGVALASSLLADRIKGGNQ